MRFYPIPMIAAMLLFTFSLAAQDDSRYNLLLKSGSFIPSKNITANKIESFNRVAARTTGKAFALVQFEKIPTEYEKQQLLHWELNC